MSTGQNLRRAFADARLMGAGLIDPRRCYVSKIVLLLGLAYPLGPIDVVPNRLPLIGYVDQIACVLGSVALSYLLLPARYRRGAPVAHPRMGFSTLAAQRARAWVLNGFGRIFAVPILRLSTGTWPSPADVSAFRFAFARFTPLPPLMRAVASIPAGREQLTRAMLASWLMADEQYRGPLRAAVAAGDTRPGNALRVWSGPPVTFLHLEKTAGMSVVAALTAEFHPLQIDADLRRAFPPHVLTPLPPFLLPQVRRCKLVWGHYDLPSVRRLGSDRFTFTFLREPRARILSLYRYWRGQAALDLGWNGMNQPVLEAQRLDLAAFLRSENPAVVNYLDNFYVRRLTGLYVMEDGRDALAEDPQGCLRAALAALESLDFVGLTEDADGSFKRLAAHLGMTTAPRVPHVNVTRAVPTKQAEAARAADVQRALARLTSLDEIIYESAVRRFKQEGSVLF
jgi:uncharacterized membrane protein YkvA (DUF1232 family)